jgi:hypothetical protein
MTGGGGSCAKGILPRVAACALSRKLHVLYTLKTAVRQLHWGTPVHVVQTFGVRSGTFNLSRVMSKQTQWLLVRKRTLPTDGRRFSANLLPTFAGGGFRVVSATGLHGC